MFIPCDNTVTMLLWSFESFGYSWPYFHFKFLAPPPVLILFVLVLCLFHVTVMWQCCCEVSSHLVTVYHIFTSNFWPHPLCFTDWLLKKLDFCTSTNFVFASFMFIPCDNNVTMLLWSFESFGYSWPYFHLKFLAPPPLFHRLTVEKIRFLYLNKFCLC